MPNNNSQTHHPRKQRNDYRHQINQNDQQRQLERNKIKAARHQKNNDQKAVHARKVKETENQAELVLRPINEKEFLEEVFQEFKDTNNRESDHPSNTESKKPRKKRPTIAEKRQARVDQCRAAKNKLTQNKKSKSKNSSKVENKPTGIIVANELKPQNPVTTEHPNVPRNKIKLHYPPKIKYVIDWKLKISFNTIFGVFKATLGEIKISREQMIFFIFMLLIHESLGDKTTKIRSGLHSHSNDRSDSKDRASQSDSNVVEKSHNVALSQRQLPNKYGHGPYQPPPPITHASQCVAIATDGFYRRCLRYLEMGNKESLREARIDIWDFMLPGEGKKRDIESIQNVFSAFAEEDRQKLLVEANDAIDVFKNELGELPEDDVQDNQASMPWIKLPVPHRSDAFYKSKYSSDPKIILNGNSYEILVDKLDPTSDVLQIDLAKAYIYGTRKELEYLINFGTNVPVIRHSLSGEIHSLLLIAPESEAVEKANLLLQAFQLQPQPKLSSDPLQIGIVAAARKGDAKLVRFYFESGGNPFAPVHSEVLENTHQIDFENSESEKGYKDRDLSTFVKNISRMRCNTAYDFALLSGEVGPLEVFLMHAEVDHINKIVFSSASVTQGRINLKQLTFFISKGFDVEQSIILNEYPYPLHFAAALPYTDFLSSLLSVSQTHLDARDFDGLTPLHCAVIAILESRAAPFDPNATPYSTLAIEMLLQLGADVDVKDNNGQTPQDLIHKAGHEYLLRLFPPVESFYKERFATKKIHELDTRGEVIRRDIPKLPNKYADNLTAFLSSVPLEHLSDCGLILTLDAGKNASGQPLVSRVCVRFVEAAHRESYGAAIADISVALAKRNYAVISAILASFSKSQRREIVQELKDLLGLTLEDSFLYQIERNHKLLEKPYRLDAFYGPVQASEKIFTYDSEKYEVVHAEDKNSVYYDLQNDLVFAYLRGTVANLVKLLDFDIEIPSIKLNGDLTEAHPITFLVPETEAVEKAKILFAANLRNYEYACQLGLIAATRKGNLALMRFYLKRGAAPLVGVYKDILQNTYLTSKDNIKSISEFAETVGLLRPDSPFAFALLSGQILPVKLLFEQYTWDNKKQLYKWVLITATRTQGKINFTLLDYLFKKGFEIDKLDGLMADNEKISVIHRASVLPYTDFLESVLKLSKKHIDTIDIWGNTPLHYAVSNLVKYRANKNSDPHATPPTIKAIEVLLGYGAKAGIRDKAGKTPLDLVPKNQHPDIHQLFEQYKPKQVPVSSYIQKYRIEIGIVSLFLLTIVSGLIFKIFFMGREKSHFPKDRSPELNKLTDALLNSKWTYDSKEKIYKNTVQFKRESELIKHFKSYRFHIPSVVALNVEKQVILTNVKKIIESTVGCAEFKENIVGENHVLSLKIAVPTLLRLPENIVELYEAIYKSSVQYQAEDKHRKNIDAANTRNDRLSYIRLEVSKLQADKAQHDKEAESKYKLIDERIQPITIRRVSENDTVLPTMGDGYQKFAKVIRYYNDNSRAYFIKKYKEFNEEYEKTFQAYKAHNETCHSYKLTEQEVAILETKFNDLKSSFDKKKDAEAKIAKNLRMLSDIQDRYNKAYVAEENRKIDEAYKKLAEEARADKSKNGKKEKKIEGSSQGASKKVAALLPVNPSPPAPAPVALPAAAKSVPYTPSFYTPAAAQVSVVAEVDEDDFDKYNRDIIAFLNQPNLLEDEQEQDEAPANTL